MDTLEQQYAKRKAFTDHGTNIPEQLLKEIAEAEAELLSNASDIIVSNLPEEIDVPASHIKSNHDACTYSVANAETSTTTP